MRLFHQKVALGLEAARWQSIDRDTLFWFGRAFVAFFAGAESLGFVQRLGSEAMAGFERRLLEYVVAHAQPGDVASVLQSMDAFWHETFPRARGAPTNRFFSSFFFFPKAHPRHSLSRERCFRAVSPMPFGKLYRAVFWTLENA